MKRVETKSDSNAETHLKTYALLLLLGGGTLFAILHFGAQFVGQHMPEFNGSSVLNIQDLMVSEFVHNLASPLPGLLLQIVVIVFFARLCVRVVQRFGQPQVIGEMLAGIILGKSFLFLVWPSAYESIFPAQSLSSLFALSQIGLILFMFVIGMELDLSKLKDRMSGAVLISHFSIVFPFLLGSSLAIALYVIYGTPKISFVPFALFIGVSMSITAFPVLARIIQEKNLGSTPLGAVAITCAAIDDVTAWIILAIVVGIARSGTAMGAIGVSLISFSYAYAMLRIVSPYLKDKLATAEWKNRTQTSKLAAMLLFLMVSALITEVIGMHALFGAFMAGVAIPRNTLDRDFLTERVEGLSQTLLLPLFFAFTGLRTQIGLISTAQDWLMCGAIILVAIAGKMGASAIAARMTGQPWRESLAIGTLMNARGLVELIVLNIGYDLGILPPTIFTMMVIMALTTTMMTGPLLTLILGREYGKNHADKKTEGTRLEAAYKIP